LWRRLPGFRDQLVNVGGVFAHRLGNGIPFRVLIGCDFQRLLKIRDPLLDGLPTRLGRAAACLGLFPRRAGLGELDVRRQMI
jgi:hypothetical protein